MSGPPRLAPQPWMQAAETRALFAALTGDGAAARFVGGCVRDAVLQRPVKDIDVATPLPPEEVMRRLRAAGLGLAPTGLKHGTVTAIVRHRPYEVTTLRRDVETFGRHARVEFTEDWRADAERRDLTINALYCDLEGQIYDYVGGLGDLVAGQVRFVGEARQRIEEDYLRLLRFFRFHAHYGRGDPDPEGLAAATALAPQLACISAERKRDELLKLLAAHDPLPVLEVMRGHGVLAQVLPWCGDLSVLAALLRLVPESDALLRLATLVPRGAVKAAEMAETLRLSAVERRRLEILLEGTSDPAAFLDGRGLRQALHRLGAAGLLDLARLAVAEGRLDTRGLAALQSAAAAWQPRRLPLLGRDLLALGLAPGEQLGQILRAVEAWWLEEDFRPDHAQCLDKARQLAGLPPSAGVA